MFRNTLLRSMIKESLTSVLPITAIVLLLSVTIAPLEPGTMVLFLFGALLLILGMSFFTMGAEMAMIPMGEGIGVQMSKAKRLLTPLVFCLLLGILITIAEPDLQVLAQQVPAVPNMILIFSVAIGVGFFLVIAELRMLLKIPLHYMLIVSYAIVFLLTIFTPADFIPVSFDSGGVTTGPITVPFIMAMGIGMASIRSDKQSANDSFGLIALCSIGPILSVLLLGIFYSPSEVDYIPVFSGEVHTTKDAAEAFLSSIPLYMKEIGIALAPIAVLFFLFQIFVRRFHRRQVLKIIAGVVYTYIGLVLFLTGVNVGFMPAGEYIGNLMAESKHNWLLIPVGMIIGYFIVAAEPAVRVLVKQVEEISNGSISHKAIEKSLSIGVALSVGLSMLRILTGVSILWFLIPGYVLSLILAFFVPRLFTGIAFDSGGVASGPMTATFLLPFAMGACEGAGGNVLTDAFGIVAMVAMTPLVTIQVLGLIGRFRANAERRRIRSRLENIDDVIVYYDA